MDKNPDNCHISLRALLFASEDRMQITKLLIHTLQRLSIASNGSSSAKELWGKNDALKTDAGSKNLKVGFEVAKLLISDHVPLYILRKSHTYEKFDLTNIHTIAKVQAKIGLREKIAK